MLTFADIWSTLQYDAPVFYFDNCSKNSPHMDFFGKDEQQALNNGTYDSTHKYDHSTVGVYLPDSDIFDYYYNCPDADKERHIKLMEDVSGNKDPVTNLAVYTVLHEYGHWYAWKKSGLSAFDYYSQSIDAKMKHDEAVKQYEESSGRIGSQAEISELYRKVPMESQAEAFVKDNAKNAMELVQKYIRNMKDFYKNIIHIGSI